MSLRGLLGVVSLATIAACVAATPAASPTPEASPLAGTRWKGVVDSSTDPRAVPWLEFAPGRLSGFSGCNLLSGTWREEGGQIRLGALAATKRACVGPASELEARVLAAVSDRARVTREGAKLVFSGPAGERFEFVRQ
jgi:heat shock protein HslJ